MWITSRAGPALVLGLAFELGAVACSPAPGPDAPPPLGAEGDTSAMVHERLAAS